MDIVQLLMSFTAGELRTSLDVNFILSLDLEVLLQIIEVIFQWS